MATVFQIHALTQVSKFGGGCDVIKYVLISPTNTEFRLGMWLRRGLGSKEIQ